jgi:5-methylcytosine-specific restriction endonuclease McrA
MSSKKKKNRQSLSEGHKRVLVLSANYEVVNFVHDMRAVIMSLNGRAEVLSHWMDAHISTPTVKIVIPSVVKLKNQIKRRTGPVRFHRSVVFRRDNWHCQYCNKKLGKREATIDHVIPTSRGGHKADYRNCVTACHSCNHKKAYKTPEEAGMALRSIPSMPSILHIYNVDPESKESWHPEWDDYIGHLR